MIPMEKQTNLRVGTAPKDCRKTSKKKGTERQPRSPSMSDRKAAYMGIMRQAGYSGKPKMHSDKTGVQHG